MNPHYLSMVNRIKGFLRGVIRNEIQKELSSNVINESNNYRIKFSDSSSKIISPLTIDGGEYIQVGSNSRIGKHAWLGAFDNYAGENFTPQIVIGNNVMIGNFACITSINKVVIEDGCLFSENVYISDHAHGFNPSLGISPSYQKLHSKGEVLIGSNTFLGIRVAVLPGVTLGKFCVVGANSVVTKSFPDYSMLAGTPAKLIGHFNWDEKKWIMI